MSSARAGRRARLAIGGALTALLVGGGWAVRDTLRAPAPAEARSPEPSERGDLRPGAGALARQRRMRARQPAQPPPDRGRAAYAEAVRAGSDSPGAAAFRAHADAFFDHNRAIAEERAAKEGVTMAELREMTYLGLLAMQLRRWGAVEEVLGRELPEDVRRRGDDLVFAASDELKRDIAAQVAAGAPASARRDTIRAAEERFVADYLAITGLSPAQYDALLARPFSER